jgi:hypothetical protein
MPKTDIKKIIENKSGKENNRFIASKSDIKVIKSNKSEGKK